MPPIPALPMLSFIYDVYTSPATQAAFKEDPEALMNSYGLTWEQKIAVYHSGADPMFLMAQNYPAGYPNFINPTKLDPANNKPNPVTCDWWASYARFKAEVEAGVPKPSPVPNPRHVNDRPEGDRVSMAGVMTLLSEELSGKSVWTSPW